MRGILKQAEQFAYRMGVAPVTIYRGVNVKLPPELQQHVRRHMQLPTNESEIDQHLNIGPALLDHLEGFRNATGSTGLGAHWTTDPKFAEIAAQQGNQGGMPIVMSGQWDGSNEDLDPHRGRMERFNGESERTLLPGASVSVNSVKIPEIAGRPSFEVLGAPSTRRA